MVTAAVAFYGSHAAAPSGGALCGMFEIFVEYFRTSYLKEKYFNQTFNCAMENVSIMPTMLRSEQNEKEAVGDADEQAEEGEAAST